MIKRALFLCLLIVGLPAFGQVTATITDADGQAWAGGSYNISFIPTTVAPNVTGSTFFAGALDSSGHLSVALQANGSSWLFSICSNTTATNPCFQKTLIILNANEDVTSLLGTPPGPRLSGSILPYVYSDTEIAPHQNTLYIRNSDGTLRFCYNGTCSGTGGGGSFTALTGDATSTSTGGATEVVGLLNNLLPSLTAGYLNWTGSAWAFSSPSGSFTALSGDATSTSTGGATTVKGINGTLLSGLGTGPLCNTITTGVPFACTSANAYPGTAATVANTGAVVTNTGFFIPFLAANTTSGQALNTATNLGYNPANGTLSTTILSVGGAAAFISSNKVSVGTSGCFQWSSSAAGSGTIDTTFCRSAAGVAEINSGTGAGAGGSLLLANLTDSALTSGQCVQASTGGLLTTTGSACGSGSSGLSGMTATQVPIAATSTTVTSSKALAGSGAAITTGPTSSTSADCAQFTGTSGQLADAGSGCATLGGNNFYTGTNTYTGSAIPIATGTTSNTDLAGFITLSGGTGTYSFTATHVSAPVCTATDTTAVAAVQATATTTVLTVNGTGTDVISYICIGRT